MNDDVRVMEDLIDNKTHLTALTLSNATALTIAVLRRVAGNDISTAINGAEITNDIVQNLLCRHLVNTVTDRRQMA